MTKRQTILFCCLLFLAEGANPCLSLPIAHTTLLEHIKSNPTTTHCLEPTALILAENHHNLQAKLEAIAPSCPSGQVNNDGACLPLCDRILYPLETSDTSKGETENCTDKTGVFYRYVSCRVGWELKSGYCVRKLQY